MDKENRAKVLEAYNRYLNAIIEADIDAINECIEYPLAYIGGGFAVMFVLLSFHADTFLRQVMINLMAVGFLVFSYFCHKLLNWILTKREET